MKREREKLSASLKEKVTPFTSGFVQASD